jgi:hypothetical protein
VGVDTKHFYAVDTTICQGGTPDPVIGPDDELLLGRRSRFWHQEPHD